MATRKFPSQFTQKVTPVSADKLIIADSEDGSIVKYITFSDVQGPQGVGITWRGAYNGATAYVVNDAVSYTNGLSYVCILDSTGNVPTNPTYWGALVQTIDASTTAKGVVEEATLSEQGAQTATGGTGARLYINPVNTAKTSSGASDENKIPVLDATGKLASGFIPEDSILYYGNGQDGAVVISSNTSLTRDMFYTDLTINNGFTLNPNGFRIHVSGTLTVNGTIARNGNVGGNASGGTAGTGGTALNTGTLGTNQAGTNGGAGVITSGGNLGVAQSALSNTFSALTGATGGNGGMVTSAGGGSGGATVTPTRGLLYNYTIPKFQVFSTLGYTNIGLYNSNVGGTGGGAGGDWSGGTSGGGGGGGSAGGIIQIFARILNISVTGQIQSNGALGGNGAGGSAGGGLAQVSGGGGGGSGGNGGTIILVFDTFTNSGSITTNGGNGGNGGNGSRSGGSNAAAGGNGGNGGNGGIVYFSKSATPGTIIATGGTGGTKGTDIGAPAPASANGTNGSSGSTITAS